MENNNSISFCIPTYNRTSDLIKAVRSILNQPELESIEYEIIINDDSPSKDTQAENQSFLDNLNNKNIRYNINSPNGQFNNLNKLIHLASKEWIVFLHDDDTINIGYILHFNKALEKSSKTDIILFGRNLVDTNEKSIGKGLAKPKDMILSMAKGSDYFDYLYSTGDPTYSGMMIGGMVTGLAIKKELAEKVGGFNLDLDINADGLFCINSFATAQYIVFVNKPLVNYTIQEQSERAIPSQTGIVYEETKKIHDLSKQYIKNNKIVNYDKSQEDLYDSVFYKKVSNLNGPILWIALRNKKGYFHRLKLQLEISMEIFCQYKKIMLYPKFYLVNLIGLLPQKFLNSLYMYYLGHLYTKQI